MRKQTELSSNIRGMAFSPRGWGDKIHDGAIAGGTNKMMPSALAVLAAAEARFIFWLVKLSGAAPVEVNHEPENVTPALSGINHQAEA